MVNVNQGLRELRLPHLPNIPAGLVDELAAALALPGDERDALAQHLAQRTPDANLVAEHDAGFPIGTFARALANHFEGDALGRLATLRGLHRMPAETDVALRGRLIAGELERLGGVYPLRGALAAVDGVTDRLGWGVLADEWDGTQHAMATKSPE